MANPLDTPLAMTNEPQPGPGSGAFVLYVEGPRDRDVLGTWAHRLQPGRGRAVSRSAVILGGRQPDRAARHFRKVRTADAFARGLCVLDRDDGCDALPADVEGEEALEFFVWQRRHIESYLMVPAAIRRSLRLPADDHRVTRACRRLLPDEGDEGAFRDLDAKRLLGEDGALSRAVGATLRPGHIARAMRREELHADVHLLFERVFAAT